MKLKKIAYCEMNGKLMALIIACLFLTGLAPVVESSMNPDSLNTVIESNTLDRTDPVVMLGSQFPSYSGLDVNKPAVAGLRITTLPTSSTIVSRPRSLPNLVPKSTAACSCFDGRGI